MFAQIGNLTEIRVQSRLTAGATESRFVHTRRTRPHDHSVKMMLTDGILDERLSRVGTHIFIVGSKLHTFHFGSRLRYTFTIHCGADIFAAMTNENSYS